MSKDEIDIMWQQAMQESIKDGQMYTRYHFAKLVAAKEREAIAQMIEEAPELVQFAQNDKGGCMVCGFTPKLATQSIRARGQA
jgi:hypothetical protein